MELRSSSPPALSASSPWRDHGIPVTFSNALHLDNFHPRRASASTISGFCSNSSSDDLGFTPNSNHGDTHQSETRSAVGTGPMRFGPICRPLSVQEGVLKCGAVESFIRLKQACDNMGLNKKFTDEQVFRVATYKNFSCGKALRLLKKIDPRYLNTTLPQIENQLRTHTLFPLPEIHSAKIDSFFYMKPSRFDPHQTPTTTIIANLIYVMDTIYERHRDYENHKIGFIANMNDWTMHNFSVDYCFQFMQALQGRMAPLNVDLFLIVNPPGWFDRVWKIMKPMLSPVFQKKVHMIKEHKLSKYLSPGFESALPADFESGRADVASLVDDYIKFLRHVEELVPKDSNANLSKPNWSPVFPNGTNRPRRWGKHLFNRRLSHSAVSHTPTQTRHNNTPSNHLPDQGAVSTSEDRSSHLDSEDSDDISIRLLE